MPKNIIFDFDGVIINSHSVQVKALEKSYKQVCGKGIPQYEEFFKNSGNSLKNIFKEMKLPLSMIPIYQKVSRENIGQITIYSGMLDLLRKLKDNDYNCALCTGKNRSRTLEILKHLKIESYFKVIVCSDDVTHPKPHPESLLAILKALDTSANEAVMVGDGINDIVCAKNAGVKSIAVTWGDVMREDLLNAGPDVIVDSAEELYESIFECVGV